MFVFPMAGMSKRFSDAGFTIPKYMLDAHGKTLFHHAVSGFCNYFRSTPFIFIARDISGAREFIARECTALGISEFEIIILENPTRGQAETVVEGLKRLSGVTLEALTIFNIDTFRKNFVFPEWVHDGNVSGYLEVFRGSGTNWSYVEIDGNGRVVRTTEKVPISDLCCTGLYHFQSTQKFITDFNTFSSHGTAARMGLKELFVAPMYNIAIERGDLIRCNVISSDDVIFCGIPEEYYEYIRRDKGDVW